MSEPDDLEKRFYEGLCLAAGGEHDRANAAFLDCVIADPGRSDFVQEFLAKLNLKFRDDRQKASLPDNHAAEPILRAAAQGQWAEVLQAGPKLLADHPGHLPTLLALTDACAATGHGAAETCYWHAVLNAAGDDVQIQRRAGQALARLHDYDAALTCWRQVAARESDAEQPARLIATLTIANSRQRSGLDHGGRPARRQSGSFKRPIVPRLDSLFSSASHPSGLSLTPIQQLEAAIRERPSIPDLYLKLAQLYLDKDRDYDAERLLAKGREATDRDARVQEMWEDVTILRHAKRVQFARQELKAADNPQTRASLAQAAKERDRAELEIFRGRCQRQPDDAASHYQLGLRLKRSEKLPEACQQFEKAIESIDQRSSAALELGHCLAELGDLPKALQHYRQAAEAAAAGGYLAEKKEALYRAGKLALQIKLRRLAQRYLDELHKIDPNYRDGAVLMQST